MHLDAHEERTDKAKYKLRYDCANASSRIAAMRGLRYPRALDEVWMNLIMSGIESGVPGIESGVPGIRSSAGCGACAAGPKAHGAP
jgi:hypothetical protein